MRETHREQKKKQKKRKESVVPRHEAHTHTHTQTERDRGELLPCEFEKEGDMGKEQYRKESRGKRWLGRTFAQGSGKKVLCWTRKDENNER